MLFASAVIGVCATRASARMYLHGDVRRWTAIDSHGREADMYELRRDAISQSLETVAEARLGARSDALSELHENVSVAMRSAVSANVHVLFPPSAVSLVSPQPVAVSAV